MVSVDGLISGLDTSGLIEQLLQVERRPIALVGQQIQIAQQKQTAFLDITARLVRLQTSVNRLSQGATFEAVNATSGDDSTLAVSASAGVPPGVYSFRVGQLASPAQFTSNGFASQDTAVGAGTLSLEFGGFVDDRTDLDDLNGGLGISRGQFRVTDRSGNNATIDISAAVTLEDVVREINENSGIQVTARIATTGDTFAGQGLVLEDTSGGSGNLTVEDLTDSNVAQELGILGSQAASTLEGSAIRTLGDNTRLATLNDGLGVREGGGPDFEFGVAVGTFSVDISDLTSVGQVVSAINDASGNGGIVTASLDANGTQIVLTDNSAAPTGITVSDPGSSGAAEDLGILGTSAGTTLTGGRLLSGVSDKFLANLNGGSGVASGSISVTNRAGTNTVIDLSGAETFQDVIGLINNAGAGVTAEINGDGNGIALRDTSGGSGTLTVSESGSTTAADLGILGSTSQALLNGSDLNPRYLSEATLLSTLNGGRGVGEGSIRVTSTSGVTFTVNLSQETTLGDVISDIDGAAGLAGIANADFEVRINDSGNGLLITDNSGAGTLRIDEVSGGTVARDLNILGSADPATPNQINGSFERTLTIGSDETLDDIIDRIEDLNFGVTATLLNDGSASPYRLNIVGDTAGSAARLQLKSAGTSLNFSQSAAARDSILFYGETSGSSQSVLVRGTSNTFDDVIDGLTVTALQTSDSPVQVTVGRNDDRVRTRVQEFVDDFNDILSTIDELTDFDLENETRGILLGDGTLRSVESRIINAAIRPMVGVDNAFQLLGEIGIRITNGRLVLNQSELNEALSTNFDAVRNLFTANRMIEASTDLDDFNNGNGVDTDANGDEIQITLRDGTEIGVDLTGASRASDIVTRINDAATAAGATLTAELEGDNNRFVLRDGTSGSSVFKVSAQNESSAANDLGLNKSADVSGGDVLTGFAINLNDDPGIASRLGDVLDELTDADDGVLQRRSDGFDTLIESLEERQERLEDRIAVRTDLLRRQFAQLEQIISSSQNTQQRLAAQLGTLGQA